MTSIEILDAARSITAPPASPLVGRGHKRHDLTEFISGDSQAETRRRIETLNHAHSPHIAAVSVRTAINRFGKIGYPKIPFGSPELFALLKYGARKETL